MLKNFKNIALYVLLGLYILQLATVFIGDFTNEIQELRRQNQITKLELAQTKFIPLKVWNSFKQKKEIIINDEYYDVVNFKILFNQVKVVAVKDSFDIHFKTTVKNILKNKCHQNSGKKKTAKNLNLSFFEEKVAFNTEKEEFKIIANHIIFYSTGKVKKLTNSIFKPPCYFT